MRGKLNSRVLATILLAFLVTACGITPVITTGDDDRDSVLPRHETDPATHAERLIAAGVEPLTGQNIVYTMDRLEAGLRRVFAGTSARVVRESERLLVRCALDHVIDPQNDEVRQEFVQRLDGLAEVLSQFPAIFLEIGVHADSAGGQRLNYRITELRASRIADQLLERDIPASRLFPVAFGESRVLVTQGSEAERAVNSRVEFLFQPVTGGD